MIKISIFIALSVISIIIYDSINKSTTRRKKSQKGAMVFLRANNAYIRKKLEEKGFNVCPCARLYYNDWLYTTTHGATICGFNESKMHLIDDARKNGMCIVDCAKSLSVFISELKKLEI